MKKIIIGMVMVAVLGVAGYFGVNYVVNEFDAACERAYSDGYDQGYSEGHDDGWEIGFNECLEEINEVSYTIRKPGASKTTEHLTFTSVLDRFLE